MFRRTRDVTLSAILGVAVPLLLLGCSNPKGTVDAGLDAGDPSDADVDAGTDAGDPSDADVDAGTDAGDAITTLDGDPDTVFEVAANGSRLFLHDLPVSGAYDFRFVGEDGVTLPRGLVLTVSYEDETIPEASVPWECGTDPRSPICRFSALAKGRIRIRVASIDAEPESFTLAPIHTLGVGAVSDPVAISATPIPSATDRWSWNAYAFTTGVAGSYRAEFDGASDDRFTFWWAEGGPTDFSPSRCHALDCALNNLEPNTRYVIGAYGPGEDLSFEIAMVKGLAMGSYGAPVPIDPSGVVNGALDVDGVGFYVFDAPAAGTYRFEATATAPQGVTVSIGFARPDTHIGTASCWTMVGDSCTLDDLVAGPNILAIGNQNVGRVDAFTLTITAEP